MDIDTIISAGLMLTGAFFMFVSGVGIVRMPDLYMRMSATTKSATIGVSCMLLSAAFYFADDLSSAARILAIIVFLFLTAPVAAHMIGRAGYYSGSELWEHTGKDELEIRKDKDELPLQRRTGKDDPRLPNTE